MVVAGSIRVRLGTGGMGVRGRKMVWFAAGAIVAGMAAAIPVGASSESGTRQIAAYGTSSFATDELVGGSLQAPELARLGSDAGGTPSDAAPIFPDRSKSNGRKADGQHSGESSRDRSNTRQLLSFDGLNHNDQRFANGGNQFSLEPPDQGLCAGNGFVLETVNDVLAVYNTSGNKLVGPVDLNTFYAYAAAINRTTGVRGPELTDPSCYFDAATQRWFHVVLTLEVVPSGANGGRLTGPNRLDIAVSQTSDPTGAWSLYHLPVQDDGTQGTPDHGCSAGSPTATWRTNPNACIGDYPHIGADANGFYVSTNEYSLFGPEYKAAQVYAFSKRALASGAATVGVSQIDTTNMVRGNQAGFTVWPAVAPNSNTGNSDDSSASRSGTEFFLSSNAADEVNAAMSGTSTDLIVWALTNTSSLNSPQPNIRMSNAVVHVGRYAMPPKAQQKPGATPLADCLNDTTLPVTATLSGCWRLAVGVEPAHNQVEGQAIDTNDTRMQQVTFANGIIYGALDTGLNINGHIRAGIEWFAARPHVTGGRVHAQLAGGGYAGLADANLSYPALAVNDNGAGVVAFTLVGPGDYPSAAYAGFDSKAGVGTIHIAQAGVGPDDGFTNYAAAFGIDPPRTRWGDYGAAVVDGSSIWVASEYIGQTCNYTQFIASPFGRCGGTRSGLANWDTRITKVAIAD